MTDQTARILNEAADSIERNVRCQTHAEANGKTNAVDHLRRLATEARPATGNPSVITDRVLSEVLAERIRQDAKWGEQNWHDFEGISILAEEVGEAAQAANEANFRSGKMPGDYSQLRAELVQVAAVAVNHIEIIDRRIAEAEESHVVADGSDDPEHVDDCPGCAPAAVGGGVSGTTNQ